jgi:hypothetical protein
MPTVKPTRYAVIENNIKRYEDDCRVTRAAEEGCR